VSLGLADILLQTSFAYNNYCCAKVKPAENLPSSNPVKQIQKNHIQSKPIIQSADSEIMSRKTRPRVIWCFSMTNQGARQPDAIKHLSNIWTDQRQNNYIIYIIRNQSKHLKQRGITKNSIIKHVSSGLKIETSFFCHRTVAEVKS